MVVAEISNPFFGTILREVEDHALELGHMVIVSHTDAKPDRELAILDRLSALRVAGIIYSPHGEPEEVVQHVSVSIPLVPIDRKLKGLEVDFVSSDNLLASAMLTEHIIRLGHKRIAHIAGRKGLWRAEQRKLGFRNTMMAAGIEIDETLS